MSVIRIQLFYLEAWPYIFLYMPYFHHWMDYARQTTNVVFLLSRMWPQVLQSDVRYIFTDFVLM